MIKIEGLLELNENNEYIVKEQNISRLLHHNWKYEIPATYSLSVGNKTFTSEEIVLQKKKAVGLLYEYHADNVNLEDRLFRACGKNIEFTVTTEAKS
jgi:hypothetical protein